MLRALAWGLGGVGSVAGRCLQLPSSCWPRRSVCWPRGPRRRPSVLLEVDALGTSKCVTRMGSMPEWENDLRYGIDKIAALPHTVV
jgi:hypothetical protein